ncbi:hypothetical protein QEH52_00220 [Coraliomargarita sp. SDUM461003]|uniref:Uncharacterized protein n=1 Tax=Thalassobacterium maritimum TaxID=3041265 RepID=A0ABU1AP70_9BACT|nr:hypothetical protein [Coraliomargarita sp. SDUM461003]MDQ8205918.1 hypothetical protein [Coraliomargarita sp. SDUM461003]
MRSDVERAQIAVAASYFAPLAKKCLRVGAYAFSIKQLAPAIRPVAFGLIQRGLANRGRLKLFKLAGVLSTVIGLLRTMRR